LSAGSSVSGRLVAAITITPCSSRSDNTKKAHQLQESNSCTHARLNRSMHARASIRQAQLQLSEANTKPSQTSSMFSPVFRDTVGETRRKGTALVLATLGRTPSIAGDKHTSPARSAVHRIG
jgi:hypothetical protein